MIRFKDALTQTMLAVGLLLHGPVWALNYKYTDLSKVTGGSGFAYAINNAGQVVGVSSQHATLWNDTTATDLGTLGGPYSVALAINNVGQVAGYSVIDNEHPDTPNYHATLWNSSTIIDLDAQGGNSGIVTSINDSGQMVGGNATLWNGTSATHLDMPDSTYVNTQAINNNGQITGASSKPGDANVHATVWNGATATDLGTIGRAYADSYATAINDKGQVTGYSYNFGNNPVFHATLWNGAITTDLGTLGKFSSKALAINNVGQVVGYNYSNDSLPHAVIWNGNVGIDLNIFLGHKLISEGWILEFANGINDNGWIVGSAYNTLKGEDHPFLLTPNDVPVPASGWLFGSGLGLLSFLWRKKQYNTEFRVSGYS